MLLGGEGRCQEDSHITTCLHGLAIEDSVVDRAPVVSCGLQYQLYKESKEAYECKAISIVVQIQNVTVDVMYTCTMVTRTQRMNSHASVGTMLAFASSDITSSRLNTIGS